MEAESGIHASELLGHGGNHLPEDLVGRGRPGQPGCYLGHDSGLPTGDTVGVPVRGGILSRNHCGVTPQLMRNRTNKRYETPTVNN